MGKLICFLVAVAAIATSQAQQQEPVRQTKPAVIQPIPVKLATQQDHDTRFENNNNSRPQQQPSILPILTPSTSESTQFQQTRDIPAVVSSSPSAHDIVFTNTQPQSQDRQHTDPRFCTKIQQPICASNGKTYPNMCLFNQDKQNDSGLSITRNGEC